MKLKRREKLESGKREGGGRRTCEGSYEATSTRSKYLYFQLN